MNRTILGGLSAVLLVGGGYMLIRPSEEKYRRSVVTVALARMGHADGPYYWSAIAPDADSSLSWCGVFALWALQKAGLAKGWGWKTGLGFLYRLPITKSPKRGDIAYFTKNQHHAIIAAVRGNVIDTINGNGTGGKVTFSTNVPLSSVAAVYSIQPLIQEALS